MLVASVLSELTDAVTSAIGDYGLYAVFLLMLVDAVFPAASEVVMVYAGAVASGAFAGQDVVLFGVEIEQGLSAYVAMALAGTIGYTVGAIIGWAIGLYGGRPYLERHGRWLHLDEKKLDRAETLVRALGELGRVPRTAHAGRPLLRLDPRGCDGGAVRPLHAAHARGLRDLVLRLRGRGLSGGRQLGGRSTTRSASPTTSLRPRSSAASAGSAGAI